MVITSSVSTSTRQQAPTSGRPVQTFGQRSAHCQIRIAKHVRLQLDLCEAVLHRVADADDPAELAVLDNRQMADAAVGHSAHDALDAVLSRANEDLMRHQVGGLELQEPDTVLDEPIDNISFR